MSTEHTRMLHAGGQQRVTVITPVYNGEPFLQACIDSVRAQSFESYRYFIVDNCSTDRTLEIADRAAAGDDRISVVRNTEHVGPIQNWNRTLSCIADGSEYLKFVHADDWLLRDCLARMVAVADANPSVGLVSAYRLEEDRISLDRLPAAAELQPGVDTVVLDGRTVARAVFRERASVLGSPTSVLYRTNLIEEGTPFFSESYLHADKESCLRILERCDFAFVRQVLTFTRRHNESITSLTNQLDTRRQDNLRLLREYGERFLTAEEFNAVLSRDVADYYAFLASKVGTRKGADFWASHRRVLGEAGVNYSKSRLARALVRYWLNPANAARQWLSERSVSARQQTGKMHEFLSTDGVRKVS